MAQFDILIGFSLIIDLLIVLYFYYIYNISSVIPSYVETKKLRNKIFATLNTVKKIITLDFYLSMLDFTYCKKFIYKKHDTI